MKLGAVIAGYILFQGFNDGLVGYVKVEADTDGRQNVFQVVGTNQVGVGFMALVAVLLKPTELEKRRAGEGFTPEWVSGTGGVWNVFDVSGYAFQVRIFHVDKDVATFGTKVIVEFTLGSENPFKRTKAFKVSHAHVGDETVIGVC